MHKLHWIVAGLLLLSCGCSTWRPPRGPFFVVAFPPDARGAPTDAQRTIGIGWFTRDGTAIPQSSFDVPNQATDVTVSGHVEYGEAIIDSITLVDSNGLPIDAAITPPEGSRPNDVHVAR